MFGPFLGAASLREGQAVWTDSPQLGGELAEEQIREGGGVRMKLPGSSVLVGS